MTKIACASCGSGFDATGACRCTTVAERSLRATAARVAEFEATEDCARLSSVSGHLRPFGVDWFALGVGGLAIALLTFVKLRHYPNAAVGYLVGAGLAVYGFARWRSFSRAAPHVMPGVVIGWRVEQRRYGESRYVVMLDSDGAQFEILAQNGSCDAAPVGAIGVAILFEDQMVEFRAAP